MNIPTGISNQMVPGLGMPLPNLQIQPSKAGGSQASFDSIYNLGLNSLKSSVSEPSANFGMNSLIKDVDDTAKKAENIRLDVLSGGGGNLHQAMIASQEANVSFKLLVEMRNKLLETYQELMRMQI